MTLSDEARHIKEALAAALAARGRKARRGAEAAISRRNDSSVKITPSASMIISSAARVNVARAVGGVRS